MDAVVAYSCDGEYVTLQFSVEGRTKCQLIALQTTRCTLGGDRKWFACPSCAKRVAVLYFRNSGFACRTCNRISYRSQSQDRIGRMGTRQQKLKERLGPLWARPRGMHATTYSRIKWEVIHLTVEREDAVEEEIQRRGWSELRQL